MRSRAEALKVYILNDAANIKELVEAWSGLSAITVFLNKIAPERISVSASAKTGAVWTKFQ